MLKIRYCRTEDARSSPKLLVLDCLTILLLFINVQTFAQSQGTIIIQTDAKSKLTLDGRELAILEPSKVFETVVEPGQKFLRIINLENNNKVYEALIDIKAGKTFSKVINFNVQIRETQVSSEDERSDENIIQTYLKGYSSVDSYDPSGYTALHRAVKTQDLKAVEILLGIGAKLDTRTKTKYNPINEMTEGAETPLHLAASGGYLNIVKKLLERGASIDATDAANMTPLHRAVESNQVSVVKFLLEAGASNRIKTKYYFDTPEKLAKKLKLREVVKIFKQVAGE